MARKKTAASRIGDTLGGSSLDAPPPKLATLRQIRARKAFRDEIYGETRKREMAKVTLPRFSWDREGA